MDKYRRKLNWNKELADLRELREKQGQQDQAESSKWELVEYEGRYSDNPESRGGSWLGRTGNVILLFVVITAGVFVGGFMLTNVLAKIANDAWKEAVSEHPILSNLGDHKFTTANYSNPKSHANLQQDNAALIRHAELMAEQKAKQQAEKDKKEKAFKAFYTKPERCIDPIDSSTKMECINEHVRARKRFNEIYAEN